MPKISEIHEMCALKASHNYRLPLQAPAAAVAAKIAVRNFEKGMARKGYDADGRARTDADGRIDVNFERMFTP